MSIFKLFNSRKYAIAGAIALAITILAVVVVATVVYSYATVEYWKINIGDKTIAVVNTESSAESVISKVKNHYVAEGADVKAISCDPEISYVQESYQNSDKPEVLTVDEAVELILIGTKEPVVYDVKNGDSLWSIAVNNGFTLDELKDMNEDKDLSMIYPGDELRLYKVKPYVTVTTEQTVTATKDIEYKTIKSKSSNVLLNTVVVKKAGSVGSKKVTETVVMENDKVVKREVLSSKVLKEPTTRVIVTGTGILPAPTNGNTYSGNGQNIVSYAMKYVGNPYIYGGASLTNGADCSGFVLAVYSHYGITMAHDADAMKNYGKSVSMAEARPGDLLCYSGHVSIYIGGGQAVHAVNEGMGIAVTGASYVGPVTDVRRIVE